MSSDKRSGAIALQSTSALTSAYGDESAGWTTQEIDVSPYDVVTFTLAYTAGTGTQLSLKPLGADDNAGDLDDYVEILTEDGAGALTVEEYTVALAGTFKAQLPPFNCTGLSRLRMAAKSDVADGTLEMTYLGYRQDGRPNPITPAAPPVKV